MVPEHQGRNGGECSGSNLVLPETRLVLAPEGTEREGALDTALRGYLSQCGEFFRP